MSALTPDAACETYAAVQRMLGWVERRFIDYLRKRLPSRRDLLDAAVSFADRPRTSRELASDAVERGFLSVLRRKVEMNALPPSGPAVSIDDLYRCAGVIAAPFVADLEGIGAVPPGAKERALKWRPQDLSLSVGAFQAGLKQALETSGVPAELTEAVMPLIGFVASHHACLSFPSPEGPAEWQMLNIRNGLVGLQAKYGCRADELFSRDEAAREFISLNTDRASFNQAIDIDLFAELEDSLDEVQGAVQSTLSSMSGQDFASYHAGSAELEQEMDGVRSSGRSMHVAYGAFLREESDLIWGKSSEPVA